jgi:hypothetical protein
VYRKSTLHYQYERSWCQKNGAQWGENDVKKWLWVIVGLIAVMLVAGFIYRDTLFFVAFRAYVKPASAFAETMAPSAPNYAKPEHWAALPDREDAADFTPEGVADGQADATVDVFFVHPTTYLSSAGWNAPMGYEPADNWVKNAVLPGQASAFNGNTRVFAPHYRQAQIYTFFALENGGYDALELAYTDIAAAFDYYLAEYNNGRPFIVAGHSQGALLARWLLERRISGTPLVEDLVAAFPIGYPMSIDELLVSMPDIPVCASATQTGCLITWNTISDGYQALLPTQGIVCVNPLTWSTDGARAGFTENAGGLSIVSETVIPGVADAQCENGMLHISEIRTDIYDDLPNMGKGNHHLLDYALYWSNIRVNVGERIEIFNSLNAKE